MPCLCNFLSLFLSLFVCFLLSSCNPCSKNLFFVLYKPPIKTCKSSVQVIKAGQLIYPGSNFLHYHLYY
ncbi:hypothetical protein GLYMA_04G000125v4 [Glycine max]|nr:hypothetical protein GLYMA_04G000125v4 [Glycine max]